jgi:hypothetical protein
VNLYDIPIQQFHAVLSAHRHVASHLGLDQFDYGLHALRAVSGQAPHRRPRKQDRPRT